MDKKNTKKKDSFRDDDSSGMEITSMTECTGMMYKPPVTDGDVEGYSDIYPVPQQTDLSGQDMHTPKTQKKRSTVKDRLRSGD